MFRIAISRERTAPVVVEAGIVIRVVVRISPVIIRGVTG